MIDDTTVKVGCNPFGCATPLVGVFLLAGLCWAWWFGLPLPGGVLDLDLLPPAVRWEPR